jgi:cytochrome b6-f complex iron-sulfur subunit
VPAGPSTAVLAPRQPPGQPVVSRRRVLQIGFWSSLGAIIAGTTAGGLDLLYPRGVGGFGGKVTVNASDVPPPGGKKEVPEGRFWLVNLTQEQGGPGLLALWWKCPHLGCTVPWKEKFVWPDPAGVPKVGWYRCPCHGSTYTDAGILVYGPAPRPLDTFELTVERGRITVDTSKITPGAPDNPDRAVRV